MKRSHRLRAFRVGASVCLLTLFLVPAFPAVNISGKVTAFSDGFNFDYEYCRRLTSFGHEPVDIRTAGDFLAKTYRFREGDIVVSVETYAMKEKPTAITVTGEDGVSITIDGGYAVAPSVTASRIVEPVDAEHSEQDPFLKIRPPAWNLDLTSGRRRFTI